jgi:tetratricopeptide (TPR) repeat protein
MFYFLFFLLLLAALVLIVRPLTVLVHELGHAIPAILLTGKKVTVYIGSYGDPDKSLRLNSRLLEIYFRYNPFAWKLGLVNPSDQSVSVNKQIIYTLTGPVASLLSAVVAFYYLVSYDVHGFIHLFLIVFMGSALLDFMVNILPDQNPIVLHNGSLVSNDGQSLKTLFLYKLSPREYRNAAELYDKGKYAEAAPIFEKLSSEMKDENVLRLAVNSYLQVRNFKKAKELSDIFILKATMSSDDYSNVGLCYSEAGLHDEAMDFYNKSLELNPDNKYALNNKGYTMNVLNRFSEAIPLFDKAIELDPDFAYSYNNRGLSKIKTGLVEDGLEDINHSFRLDANNSYGYRNLGVYHMDNQEFSKALELFTKAKELDPSTHIIDDLIREAESKVSEKFPTPVM